MSINQSFSAQVRFRLMASILIAAALPCACGAGESTKSPPLAAHQVITVGPADADVVGTTGRAVQIAIDALAHRGGGGEVRVKPGEYASPQWWEVDAEGVIHVHLVYDHEREAPNRANGHWNFRIEAEPGANLTIMLGPFANIYGASG